jgi:precorrin-6A/cobalt-precorrin-6A reductase
MIVSQGLTMTRILLLGGTTEASLMARALAEAGMDAVFSYAGRTADPVAQPLPQRVGGFGGVAGLVGYLRAEGISHVIDATHPFAAGMSGNAVEACAAAGCGLIALQRQPWVAGPLDRWTHVQDIAAAVGALPDAATRVFLAIGRQHVDLFAGAPQHQYLLRLVDAPQGTLALPHTEIVLARGPFRVEDDVALMQLHRVQIVVAKNSGGSGARAKIDAAAQLGLHVVMIDRPALPNRKVVETVAEVMAWLGHPALRGV